MSWRSKRCAIAHYLVIVGYFWRSPSNRPILIFLPSWVWPERSFGDGRVALVLRLFWPLIDLVKIGPTWIQARWEPKDNTAFAALFLHW